MLNEFQLQDNMRTIHHFGIPVSYPVAGESYNESLHLYCTDPASSPNRIEFLRFEEECPFPALVKSLPHIAYKIDSMEELTGCNIIYGPFRPTPELTVVFIEEEEIPIELDIFE